MSLLQVRHVDICVFRYIEEVIQDSEAYGYLKWSNKHNMVDQAILPNQSIHLLKVNNVAQRLSSENLDFKDHWWFNL